MCIRDSSGTVSAGAPIIGTLTDGAGNSVGYELSTVGPLFFGWNGQAGSEVSGVQTNFAQSSTINDWIFTLSFDRPIDQLSLGQTNLFSTGANAGGMLLFFSDAASNSVNLGTPGLGPDGLSNLGSSSALNSGDVIT